MDDETEEESSYTYFYTPPKTPPRDLDKLVDARIQEYRRLIEACKEHLALDKTVETLFYKDIEKAYRRFAFKNHPDKGGDKKEFQKGGGAWKALNKTLNEDEEEGKIELGGDKLKKATKPLLKHLKSYLKTHIEKNIETYRNKDSTISPQ